MEGWNLEVARGVQLEVVTLAGWLAGAGLMGRDQREAASSLVDFWGGGCGYGGRGVRDLSLFRLGLAANASWVRTNRQAALVSRKAKGSGNNGLALAAQPGGRVGRWGGLLE